MVDSSAAQWQAEAIKRQREMGRLFGYEAWDVTPKGQLIKRVGIALYGIKPSGHSDSISIDTYDEKQKKRLEKLVECIMKDQHPMNIRNRFILILGLIDSETQFEQWVFSVPANANPLMQKFIDNNCRSYKNWEDYLSNNTLPEALICYPTNGIYKRNGDIDISKTPAYSGTEQFLKICDVTHCATSVGCCSLIAASLFFPISTPFVVGCSVIAAAGGTYEMGRGISKLVDRYKHDQTINLSDNSARLLWLSAVGPVFAMGAGGATIFVKYMAETGGTLSTVTKIALNAANISNCGMTAAVLGNSVTNIIQKVQDKEDVDAIEVLNVVASALLFSNAVISTRQARLLLAEIPKDGSSSWRIWLTRLISQNSPVRKLVNFINSDEAFNNIILPQIYVQASFLGVSSKIIIGFVKLYQFVKISLISLQNGAMTHAEFLIKLVPQLCSLWQQLKDDLIEAIRKLFKVQLYSETKNETSNAVHSIRKPMTTVEKLQVCQAVESTPASDKNKIMELACKFSIFQNLKSKEDVTKCILFVCSFVKIKAREKEEEYKNKLQKAKEQFPNMNENDLKRILGMEENVCDGVLKELQQTESLWIELNGAFTSRQFTVMRDTPETRTIGLKSIDKVDVSAFSFKMDDGETLKQKYKRFIQGMIQPFPRDVKEYESADVFMMIFHNSPYKMAFMFGVPEGNNVSGLIFFIKN